MTNRYYKNNPPNIKQTTILHDLRREGLSDYDILRTHAIERRLQTMLRVYLSREVAYCNIDNQPCSDEYCSTCLRNR